MKVYPVFIFDPKALKVRGITAIYDSYDSAANALEDNFMNGFIDCTDITDMYVNCEGQLLIIQEYELNRGKYSASPADIVEAIDSHCGIHHH